MKTSSKTIAYCLQCTASFAVPQLAEELRAQTALTVRTGKPLEAVMILAHTSEISLADAKAVVHHITRIPGKCHRCKEPLTRYGESECPKCKSLNLDW